MYVLVNGTLGIREVRKEDEGLGTGGGADTYRCFALSTLGLAIAPVTLRVDGPPNRLPLVVVRGPANLTRRAVAGDSGASVLRLPCVVGVYGPPSAAAAYAGRMSVKWRRNGTLLPRDKFPVYANRTLVLRGLQASDSGWYECVVSSDVDADLYRAGGSLTVLAAGGGGAQSSGSGAGDEEARLPPRPSKPTIDNGGVLDTSVSLVWNLQLPSALGEQQLRDLSFHLEYFSPDWNAKVCSPPVLPLPPPLALPASRARALICLTD